MATSEGSSPAIKCIAAIDLGTNSFHAVLVDIYPDGSFAAGKEGSRVLNIGDWG